MNYQIIVYCWEMEEETPASIIELKVKENAWFLFHRYLEIGPDGRENISIVELWENNTSENKSVLLAAYQF
jgi:hypothetical protein